MSRKKPDPSPWSEAGWCGPMVIESHEWIVKKMHARRSSLGKLTERQRIAIRDLVYDGMDYGWLSAVATVRARSVRSCVRARAKQADERHAAIRTTFGRMSKGGKDVTVAAVAKACGVSLATAYRAMSGKKHRRRR